MMSNQNNSQKGQTVLEFAFLIGIVSCIFGGATLLLAEQWKRTRCAYLVFEAVHAFRREDPFYLEKSVEIYSSNAWIEGSAWCGRNFEKVRLPRLESAVW